MPSVTVGQVDERDSHWERHHPRYRVYLHSSGPDSTAGSTDAYDIEGADLLQVIDWAQRRAGDILTFAVALVCDDAEENRRNPGNGRGLIWLVGMDGNDTAVDTWEVEIQRRMLNRRVQPVQLSVSDSMPFGSPTP